MAGTSGPAPGSKRRLRLTTTTDTSSTPLNGEVIGLVAANGANVWRGVPYGASTAGAQSMAGPHSPLPIGTVSAKAVSFAPRVAPSSPIGEMRMTG